MTITTLAGSGNSDRTCTNEPISPPPASASSIEVQKEEPEEQIAIKKEHTEPPTKIINRPVEPIFIEDISSSENSSPRQSETSEQCPVPLQTTPSSIIATSDPSPKQTSASNNIDIDDNDVDNPETIALMKTLGIDVENFESMRCFKREPADQPTDSIYTQEELEKEESGSNSPASTSTAAAAAPPPAAPPQQKTDQELLHSQFRKGTAITFASVCLQSQQGGQSLTNGCSNRKTSSNGNISPGSSMLVIDEEEGEIESSQQIENGGQNGRMNKQQVINEEPVIEDFRLSNPKSHESSRRIEYGTSLQSHHRSNSHSSKRYGRHHTNDKKSSHRSRSRSRSPLNKPRNSRSKSRDKRSSSKHDRSSRGRDSNRRSRRSDSSSSSDSSERSRRSSKSRSPSVDRNFDKAWLDNSKENRRSSSKSKKKNIDKSTALKIDVNDHYNNLKQLEKLNKGRHAGGFAGD